MNTKDFGFEIKAVSDSGTFSGYGSVFGVKDSYGDIVVQGAFNDSLQDHRSKSRMPAMLWQHRSSEPIGVYTSMTEDNIGLHVEGQLALTTVRGAEAHALMKMGALTGLSIGFQTRLESYDKVSGINTLQKVDLWEVSPVTFPANDAARISGVKAIELIKDLKSAEALLRESGMSRQEAVLFIARIKSLTQRESDEDVAVRGLVEAITRRNNVFTN
jgi:HK97 family phage prohead protease